jgi:tryptophanyl-tRNA synthetase
MGSTKITMHATKPGRVLSGLRPTGRIHLGHLVGALNNWIKLQHKYECYFFVADWHALTTHYADTSQLQQFIQESVTDYLAVGLDPTKTVLFQQSHVPQHAELHLLLSFITPLGWLERVPTYKTLRDNIQDKELGTYGFLGYPVLQSSDILIYKATHVPVGEDQVSHIELTREICRRFQNIYGKVFPEPQPLLTPTPRLPGTDGRKMSKSYNNSIYLSDPESVVREKVSAMFTDPARKRRSDPGNPDVCPVYAYHKLCSPPETVEMVNVECRRAGIGCVDDKKLMADHLVKFIEPFRETRFEIESKPDQIWDILEQGSRSARETAESTMQDVRKVMKLTRIDSGKQ